MKIHFEKINTALEDAVHTPFSILVVSKKVGCRNLISMEESNNFYF